jgi:two-component system NtrC family sensor kinase
MKVLRIAGTLLALLALAAPLAYLYVKTQAVSMEQKNLVSLHLVELRELDAQWNVDILRSRQGLNKHYDAITDPLTQIRAVQDVLESETVALPGTAAPEAIAKLRAIFDEKIELVDRFKSQNAVLRNSLRYLPTGAQDLKETALALQRDDVDMEKKLVPLVDRVNDLLTEILKFNLLADSSTAERASNKIIAIDALRASDFLPVNEPLAILMNHARTVLHQRTVEDALLKSIVSVPIADGINAVASAFDREFETALSEKQRYRGYLLAYSSLLLALLAYAGWRLSKSYKVIAKMNRELQLANQTLAQRVEERTAELSAALAELKESEAQLIQSEKMATLGQMVAGVAHEINTPLAYVRSSLETVDSHLTGFVAELLVQQETLLQAIKSGDNDRVREQLFKVNELQREFSENEVLKELTSLLKDGIYGVDQISELVVTLKNFTRLDRQKVVEFDLREGLRNTLLIAKNLVKNKTVKTHFRDIPLVTCSPSQINQVFLNLISNAAHATSDENGTIYVVTGRHNDTHVKVEVIDNGCGIPEDVLPRVLEPFFTTKPAGQGTGLGLSIVRKIVEEHGGKIEISSKVGTGTKVSVLLPIAQRDALAAAA